MTCSTYGDLYCWRCNFSLILCREMMLRSDLSPGHVSCVDGGELGFERWVKHCRCSSEMGEPFVRSYSTYPFLSCCSTSSIFLWSSWNSTMYAAAATTLPNVTPMMPLPRAPCLALRSSFEPKIVTASFRKA